MLFLPLSEVFFEILKLFIRKRNHTCSWNLNFVTVSAKEKTHRVVPEPMNIGHILTHELVNICSNTNV